MAKIVHPNTWQPRSFEGTLKSAVNMVTSEWCTIVPREAQIMSVHPGISQYNLPISLGLILRIESRYDCFWRMK
tara:strand:+ start:953 stop:1174 length:222 start_codon:yes stop_codon:yes gene_type:complete